MANIQNVSLERTLSPTQVWALALGSIVGWGCFVLPGDKFLPEAGPLAALIGFAIGTLLLCFVAVSYSYMIRYAPVAGGEYAYAYIGYGPTNAFICGWALVLGYISIIAINISALALLCRFLLPGVFEVGELYTLAGWKIYTGEVILMICTVLFFGILNYRGISFAGTFQVILAFMLSAGILLLFFGTFTIDSFALSNTTPVFAESRAPILSILSIVAISPFLFVGFDTVPQASEEFNFSPDKSKKIMIFAIIWGGILYSMVTFAVSTAMPYPDMLAKMGNLKNTGKTAWATGEVCRMAYGNLGAVILACAVLGAVCTGINGFYVATTRLLLSMARGHILPKWFGDIHPYYRTPYKAILFTICLVLLTPFAGRAVVGWIVDMSSVGTAVAYLFTCLTAIKVLKHARSAQAPIICSWLGAFTSVACMALLLIPGSPAYISAPSRWIMVIWIAMGIIFYFISKSHWITLTEEERKTSILGRNDLPIFFDNK